MPADVEEIVVHADRCHVEDIGEGRTQQFTPYVRGPAPAGCVRTVVRSRQCPAIQLAVRVQWQRVLHHHRGRHHVLRQPRRGQAAQKARQRVAVNIRISGDHVRHEARVPRRILPHDDRGLPYLGMRGQYGLDLTGLDPKPPDLHLVVRAAGVHELPVGGPPRHVARPVHPLARRPERTRDEPLGRQRRPAMIAPGQSRPRDVQLPGHPRRHRVQPGVEHVRPDVGDGCTDRWNRRYVPVGVPRRGVDRRLGRPVDVGDPDAGQSRANPGDRPGGQRLAGQDHRTGTGAGPDVAHEAGERGRHRADQARRPGAVVAIGQDEQVLDDLDAAAGHQGTEDLEHRHIEGQRGGGQHPGELLGAERAARPGHQAGDRTVLDDHALGRTGRSRRVDQVGRIGGGRRGDPLGVGQARTVKCRYLRRDRRVVRRHDGNVDSLSHLGEAASLSGARQHAHRVRVGQEKTDPLGGIVRIDRQVRTAGLPHREDPDDHLHSSRQAQPHHALRSDPAADQLAGQPVRPRVQLGVADLDSPADNRDRVRSSGSLRREQLRYRCGGYLDRGVVPVGHNHATLRLRQDVHAAQPGRRILSQCFQHPRPAPADLLDRIWIEQVRGPDQDAADPLRQPVRAEHLADAQLQIEPGRRRRRGLPRHLHVR